MRYHINDTYRYSFGHPNPDASHSQKREGNEMQIGNRKEII
jgi:hypothetical protein